MEPQLVEHESVAVREVTARSVGGQVEQAHREAHSRPDGVLDRERPPEDLVKLRSMQSSGVEEVREHDGPTVTGAIPVRNDGVLAPCLALEPEFPCGIARGPERRVGGVGYESAGRRFGQDADIAVHERAQTAKNELARSGGAGSHHGLCHAPELEQAA